VGVRWRPGRGDATALLLPAVRAGETGELDAAASWPRAGPAFRVDALGLTFALLASRLWIVTSVYSSGYVRADNLKHRPRYFAAFAASIGAASAWRSPATCSRSSCSTSC
jgi:multicomponent Na+:H+ antiporter subunit D